MQMFRTTVVVLKNRYKDYGLQILFLIATFTLTTIFLHAFLLKVFPDWVFAISSYDQAVHWFSFLAESLH